MSPEQVTKSSRNICSLCSPLLSKREETLGKASEEVDLEEVDLEAEWEVHMLCLLEEDQEVAWEVQKLVLDEGDQEGAFHEWAKGVQVPSGVVGFQVASLAEASYHHGGTVANLNLLEVASLLDGDPNWVGVFLDPSQDEKEDLEAPIRLVAGFSILLAGVDFVNPTVHA